ncbi:hypothetical protein DITRI_Ditri17bG0034300 [Diplodiscus trichospermus]
MAISNLTRLVSLDLSNQDICYWRNYYGTIDSFDGYYPSLKLEKPNFKTLIKNLKSLKELYLDSVDISTQSSKWCESTSLLLPNLRVLSMSGCGLTGPLCSSLSKLHFLSKLNLDRNPISYLPPNFLENSSSLVSLSLSSCNLSGHFPTEVLLLPKMQTIDISYNLNLTGHLPEFPINNNLQVLTLKWTNFSENLPNSIGNLKFLTELNIAGCYFSGAIPSSIANLTNLVDLYLSDNNFSGLIPPFHSFGVPNLAYLYLDANRLSGSIPSSLFTLPSLHSLSLDYNQLVGEIDEFPNASSSLIEYLDLSLNYLGGSIPKSILQLPLLELLDVGYNNFGSMKLDIFFQLKNLKYLYLSNVRLLLESDNKSFIFPQLEELTLKSCNFTKFPEFIKTQDKLASLDLSNNHIHGSVPRWLWKSTLSSLDLSFNAIDFPKDLPFGDANSSFPMLMALYLKSCNISTFPKFLESQKYLEYLDLSGNKISGAIPNWLWRKSMRHLILSHNHLSSLGQPLPNQSLTSSQGSLPRSICNLSQLELFNASYNNLNGPIPNCLGNMSYLYLLDLQGNNFSGILPKFAEASQLEILKVSENRLEGRLPRSLKIGGNKLEGQLPRSLANCTELEVLDLGNNMFHDTFPFWLEKLPSLKVLILRSNRFYGTLNNFETQYVFPMLQILDIASNNFSGDLSIEFLQCLRAMKLMIDGNKAKLPYIGEDYYQDSVTIVNKGIEIFYKKILTILTCLDLSNNSFHGRIPEEIQNLTSVKVLNLSQNSFFGQIPLALENLKDLESLDLSQNKLSGKIPPQLATLTFLAALNLSYNQLEESIPQSNQFITFSNDSFKGNPRLCGPPLLRKCNEVDATGPPAPRKDEESWVDGISCWEIALIGYGSGLMIGFCIGYMVLNEFGNKCVDSFTWNKNRKWRRSS